MSSDQAIEITAPGTRLQSLHAALISRIHSVECSIDARESPSEFLTLRRTVLMELIDAIDRYYRNSTVVFTHTLDSKEATVLRDELVDMYGAVRPDDVENVIDAHVETVFTRLLGYVHRLDPGLQN